jgi:general nucleoside transport system permease protein
MSLSVNMTLVAAVIASSILSGTSLFYATLGELVGERAGIVNLGLEGLMLIGAAVGFAVTALSGDAYLGLVAAAVAGLCANMIFAYVVVGRGANQLAAGLTLMFLGLGVSTLIGRPFVGEVVAGLPRFGFGGFGSYDLLAWLALPSAFGLWALLFRTRWGLALRAVGEDPAAAYAAGKSPNRIRYQALAFAGALGAIGGAHLALALTHTWDEGMTAGRGFIAIALVIFAKWNPLWAVAGALVFGGAEIAQLELQARGADVSPFLMNMVPYLLTLLVLMFWGFNRRAAAPAALGRNFFGVE